MGNSPEFYWTGLLQEGLVGITEGTKEGGDAVVRHGEASLQKFIENGSYSQPVLQPDIFHTLKKFCVVGG
ncbi:MAG: hypothetical protein D3904_11670 [Candidatus Electrothrix sp. EH2]|nr:hypothetical protein [Candidatus Electrothrix sp. EH2]